MFPSSKESKTPETTAQAAPAAPPAPSAASSVPRSKPGTIALPSLQPDLRALLGHVSHKEPLLVADFYREKVEEWMAAYVRQSLAGDYNNGLRDLAWSAIKRDVFAKRVNEKVQEWCKDESRLDAFAAQVQYDLSGPWVVQQAGYGDLYDLWFEKVAEHEQKTGKKPPSGIFEKDYLTRCYHAAGHLSELAEIFQISSLKRAQSGHPVLAERFDYFKTAFNFIYNTQTADKKIADEFLRALKEVKPKTDAEFQKFFLPMLRKGTLPNNDMLSNMYNQMFDELLKDTIHEFCTTARERKEKKIQGTYAAHFARMFNRVVIGSGKVVHVASNVANKVVDKGLNWYTGATDPDDVPFRHADASDDDDTQYTSSDSESEQGQEQEEMPAPHFYQPYNMETMQDDYVSAPPAVITNTTASGQAPLIDLSDEYAPSAPAAGPSHVAPAMMLLRTAPVPAALKQSAQDDDDTLMPSLLQSQMDDDGDSSESEEELDAITKNAHQKPKFRFVQGKS